MAENNPKEQEKPQQSVFDQGIGLLKQLKESAFIWWDKVQHLERSNMELGILHLKNGNFFDAAMRFRLVILLNRTNGVAYYLLGKSYVYQQKFKKAVSPLKKALQLRPDLEEAEFLLAVCGAVPPVGAIPRSFVVEKSDTLALEDVYANFRESMINPLHFELREELGKHYEKERIGFNVLDIGAKGGEGALIVRHRANSITGIEPALRMAGRARNLREENLLVYNNLYTKFPQDYLPETKERFDIVLCTFYLDNYADLEPLFTQIRNVMLDKATFGFNTKPITNANFGFIPGTMVFGHSDEYIKKLAAKLGFNVVSHRNITYSGGGSDSLFLLEKN